MADWSTASGSATEASLELTSTAVPSFVAATIPGPQALTSGGFTFVDWTVDEEGGDLTGSFDSVSGVFTAPKDMTVRATLKLEWDEANTTGSVRLLTLSGSSSFRRTEMLRSTPLIDGGYGQTISVTADVSEGDTFQGSTFLSAAGNANIARVTLLLSELKIDA